MKKIITIISLALIFSTAAFAQSNDTETKKDKVNPEEIARKRTDNMRDALSLDDDQYEKIYKINLKEAKSMSEHRRMQGGMRRGGGRQQMGGRQGMGGMRRQTMDNDEMPNDMQMGNQANATVSKEKMDAERQENREKRMKKYNEKIEQILTAEQMEKWTEMENKRRNDEFNKLSQPKD